jgi:uncharacterized membrane protein YgaE (UPF0421/DUF939 family)
VQPDVKVAGRSGRIDVSPWRRAAAQAVHGARSRMRDNFWPVLQGTAAAAVAWLIAGHLVAHHQPFFAPIAAVIGLNAARGSRGLNAARMLVGAVVGIAVAEAALYVHGGGYGTLAVSVFAAMMIAVAINAERIVIGQAAAGAILTVTIGYPEAGGQRLVDVLIGAGVALVFSQLLFPAEPLALLRRAEAAALAEMADGLELTARALESGGAEPAYPAIERMRHASDRLTELGGTRRRSSKYVRHTALWWRRRALIVRESEDAGKLDLLGSSCFTLARTALAASEAERAELAGPVRELAEVVAVLAVAPGERDARRRAAHRALGIVHRLVESPETHSPLVTGRTLVRMAATDVLLFTGVDRATATGARRPEKGRLHVPVPPAAPRLPFAHGLRRPRG